MAGGFFSESGQTPKAVDTPSQSSTSTTKTSESSPGGFFGTGTDVNATRNAAASDADARKWASYSKGWAVGSSTGSLSDFGDQNNSKYYAEQSQTFSVEANNRATAAAASASAANASASSAVAARDLTLGYRNQAEEYRDEAAGFASKTDSDAAASAASSIEAITAAQRADSDAAVADMRANAAATSAMSAMGFAGTASQAAARAAADSEGTSADRAAVETIYTSIQAAEMRIADSEANTAASATAAAASATDAKNWAVGPSGTGSGTDTNNAMYWALQARAANDVEIVQLELNAGSPTPVGVRFENPYEAIYLDSERYHVEEPIVTYNGVVLTEGDHYTVDSDGSEINFDSAVAISSGDCITVTGASENSSPDILPTLMPASPSTGQMYFDLGGNRIRIWNGSAWRNIATTG